MARTSASGERKLAIEQCGTAAATFQRQLTTERYGRSTSKDFAQELRADVDSKLRSGAPWPFDDCNLAFSATSFAKHERRDSIAMAMGLALESRLPASTEKQDALVSCTGALGKLEQLGSRNGLRDRDFCLVRAANGAIPKRAHPSVAALTHESLERAVLKPFRANTAGPPNVHEEKRSKPTRPFHFVHRLHELLGRVAPAPVAPGEQLEFLHGSSALAQSAPRCE